MSKNTKLTKPLLSVVTAGLLQRANESSMYWQIQEQIRDRGTEVEYYALIDNGPMSTGSKVGELFQLCHGKYICRIDDDDRIEDDYFKTLLDAIREHDGVDVITFDHTYYVDGKLRAMTKQIPRCKQKMHSIKKGEEYAVYDRLPGILCPVREEIAKGFVHPDTSEKEDYAYKDFLKTNAETYHHVDRVLYHHLWATKNQRDRAALQWKWGRF